MKEIDIYSYYAFGFNYNIFKKGLHGKTIEKALDSIDGYLEKINELELQVTSQIVWELEEIADELREKKQEETLSIELADKIKKITNDADQTLDAELQLKKVLTVTPKRFNLEMLLNSPSKLLAKNSWGKMPIIAQADFKSGTRCIAMNLSTAGAFHLMRCVEEMVKQLYFCFVKQKRMKKPMWGTMVDKLKTKKRPRPNLELLDQLDMLRKNFRNPTQHPEKFYSTDEAQDLLNSTIVAINMITKTLIDRKCA
ncbi:MAG: hypothetical protein K8R86_10590 [Bacteroidales bacterium]|nr:hypothetical protein [Bacteroidales bacterium]